MHRTNKRLKAIVLSVALVSSLTTSSVAASGAQPAPSRGSGVGELHLDRGAVRALLTAAMAGPRRIELPALGAATLTFQAPRVLEFRDGGIETTLPFRLVLNEVTSHDASLQARLVPELDRLSGQVRLVAESAAADVGLPARLDLSALLPPVALPRGFHGSLPETLTTDPSQLALFVHAVRVDPERLVIEFGVTIASNPVARAR